MESVPFNAVSREFRQRHKQAVTATGGSLEFVPPGMGPVGRADGSISGAWRSGYAFECENARHLINSGGWRPSSLGSTRVGASPLGRVGEEVSGILSLPDTDSLGSKSLKPRLPTGVSGIWDSRSSMHIIRDLYDGYAADPLSNSLGLAPPEPMKSARAVATLGFSDSDDTPRPPRPCFFQRYVERQAEIEGLIATGRPKRPRDLLAKGDGAAQGSGEVGASVVEEAQVVPMWALDVLFALVPAPALNFVAQTRSVVLEGDVLSSWQWSGGVHVAPHDSHAFRLGVFPLESLDTHPIFVGIMPADAEPSEVSFFDFKDGVFLRVGNPVHQGRQDFCGGIPSRREAPEFYVFGERQPAALATPTSGQGVAVHFVEEFQIPAGRMADRVRAVVERGRQSVGQAYGEMVAEAVALFDFEEEEARELVESRLEQARAGQLAPVSATIRSYFGAERSLKRAERDLQAFLARKDEVEAEEDGRGTSVQSVRFQVGDAGGARSASPDLSHRGLDAAAWRPCVLLCQPGTRTRVQWLAPRAGAV